MNPLDDGLLTAERVVWDLPGGTPAALGVALLAALLSTVLAVRALRRRPGAGRLPAWGAALARAIAVAAAVLAAAGPQALSMDGRAGERAAAAHDDADLNGLADRVLRWPEDAPTADAALEILRAAADADEPLELLLAAGTDSPSGDAVERGLRRTRQVSASVWTTAASASGSAPSARPSLLDAPYVSAPSGATEGVPVTLDVQSPDGPFAATQAKIRIGDREGTIDVDDGARRVSSPPLDLPAGTHLARVDLPDRSPAVTFVQVGRAPRVAYVAKDAAAHPIVATLAAQGLDVTAREPRDAALSGFADADVIVLGPGAADGALAARVAGGVEAGAGLLVIGGAGDDGLRRLAGSAVEPLLPVTLPAAPPPPPPDPDPPEADPPQPDRPDPPTDDENPDVRMEDGPKDAMRIALLLVIDRSGSMAGPKIRLAQMASIAAARNLSAEDRVGVLAFDDRTRWVAPFQNAGDMHTLNRRIAGLRAEGGTDFFPALKEGFTEILRQRCGIRHVILLSDGATRAAVFRPTVEGASSEGVTLSTIAIGDGADTRLLGLIAGWGQGRLYLATNPERLPEVVTVDTRRFTVEERERRLDDLAEKPEGLPDAPPGVDTPDETTADVDAPETDAEPLEPEVVAPRVPRVVANAALLAGLLDAEWPALPHPEDPAPRPVTLVVLGWEGGAPALTLGRHGESRVAVLAADAASQDAAALFSWERGGPFLAQLVRSLAAPPDLSAGGVVATMTRALDGSARVAVPIGADGLLRLRPVDGGDELVVRCTRVGGAWTGGRLASTPDAGVLAGIFVPSTGGGAPREVALVSRGTAREPRHELTDLALAAGAPLVDAPPEVPGAEPVERRSPVGAPLLGLAALLLVVEAGLRRAT